MPDPETTAKGAAVMAGLATGLYKIDKVKELDITGGRHFEPKISTEKRASMLKGWKRAFSSLDDEDHN